MKTWIWGIVLGIVAIAPLTYFAYAYIHFEEKGTSRGTVVIDFMSEEHKAMEPSSEFRIRSCHVVDGYKFAILLENGEWIDAHLAVATKSEASQVVVDLLKKSHVPTIILRRKVDDYWIVNFHLTLDGKEVILRNLLKERGLIL